MPTSSPVETSSFLDHLANSSKQLLPSQIVMGPRSSRRFRTSNAIFTALMGLGSMSYGYAAIVVSVTLAQPSFIHYMGLDHRDDANDLIGLTGSLFQAGGFVGTFFVSFFADRWGRRVGIAFPAAVAVASAALLAGSVNIGMFIAFRFFAGAAACMIVSAVTLWMTEVVPPNVRGSFVNVNGASILLGGVVAAWVGYGFSQYQPGNLDSRNWRATQALGVLPALILLCGLYWLPESPRWLIRQGRIDEAQRTLSRLHTPEEAALELIQIRAQIQHDENLEDSYLSLITRKSYRKRALLATLTTVATQMTGPLVIVNYGPIIYGTLGFDTNKQLIYQGGWILVGFGGGLISLLIIDLTTRPRLIAAGMLGCLAMLAVEAALVATYATSPESLAHPNKSALQAAVAMFYVNAPSHFAIPFLDGAEGSLTQCH
jgi:MFS family permease